MYSVYLFKLTSTCPPKFCDW